MFNPHIYLFITFTYVIFFSKKKKKRGRQRRKKISATWVKVQLYMGIFIQKWCLISHFSFLSILERKLFGGSGEKTPRSHHLFSFLPIQPNTLQKSFFFHFFFKVFYLPCFTSKQTHPKGHFGGWRVFLVILEFLGDILLILEVWGY